MGKVKQIEIKNSTYYFYNNVINILQEFNSSLPKVGKKWDKDVDIYYIGYITIKKIGDCENTDSVNPLYLMIGEVIGHIECNSIECNSIECSSGEKSNESKYLVFYSTDENKEVLKKYTTLGWD